MVRLTDCADMISAVFTVDVKQEYNGSKQKVTKVVSLCKNGAKA